MDQRSPYIGEAKSLRISARQKLKQHLKTLIKLGSSVAIVDYLIHRFHLHTNIFHIANPIYLLAAALLLLFQPLVMVIRWHWLLACFEHIISYIKLTSILFISLFLNQFLPASVGGDAVRIWYGRQEGVPLAAIAASVLMDRVCALFGLLIMIALLLPLAHRVIADPSVVVGLGVLVLAGVIGIIGLALLRPWTRLPKKTRFMVILAFPTNTFYRLCSRPKILLMTLALSVAVHLITTLCLYCIIVSLGEHLSVLQAAVLLPPITLAQMIPISIGGWGVREVAAVAALTSAGLDPTHSLAISLMFGMLVAVASLPGALFWVIHRRQFQGRRQ
jgi:uncharacterized membrane protein YbhN (UPF0104 family)